MMFDRLINSIIYKERFMNHSFIFFVEHLTAIFHVHSMLVLIDRAFRYIG